MSPTSTSRRAVRRAAGALAVVAALVSTALLMPGPASAAAPAHGPGVQRLCAAPAKPGMLACNAVRQTGTAAPSATSPRPLPHGYGPAQLRGAYRLPAGGGAGVTVAVVDAQDDPRAEADLAKYRRTYGLPPCTTANGCFRKVAQDGSTAYPAPDAGWAGEIALDLDMVSATAPRARILLVEARSASVHDLGEAVNTAVRLGAKVVSNSYGGAEDASIAGADRRYFHHPGVAFTASAGDSGYGVEYPASSPYVTAVGGTSLRRAPGTLRGWRESVWHRGRTEGTGSGCSRQEAKPAWQKDTGCAGRTVADVAAVADPATGVAVYNSYRSDGWGVYGGTSAAAPIIAGVYADAGVPSAGSNPGSFPYAHRRALHDVVSGSNGACSVTYLCTARVGYDGPTGLGTPNGLAAFTG